MSEVDNPELNAQEAYEQKVAILKSLHGKDNISLEIDAIDQLGLNSLQLILNKFGKYDAGWIDDEEFDDCIKKRIIALNRQDIVSTNAASKALLRKIHSIENTLSVIKWSLIGIALLNFLLLFR